MEIIDRQTKDDLINWIRKVYKEIPYPNSDSCSLVIGISGNMDSAVTAALCAEAVGADRIIGVIMPCGKDGNKYNAVDICNYLNINYIEADITDSIKQLKNCYHEMYIPSTDEYIEFGNDCDISCVAPGMKEITRMLVLRMIANSFNGLVVNTCNLSERYTNKFHDSNYSTCGYIAPIINLTDDEVMSIGRYMELPGFFFVRTLYDDWSETDYSDVNNYIRTGKCDNKSVAKEYSTMMRQSIANDALPYKFYPNAEVTVSFFD